MNMKTDMDWTDALRETLEGAELTPSDGGWQRLRADLHPRKSVHWPYYLLSAVACAAVCGVFLFRDAPSGQRVEVVGSSSPVADMPQAVVEMEPAPAEAEPAGEFVPSAVKPAAVFAADPFVESVAGVVTETDEETEFVEDAAVLIGNVPVEAPLSEPETDEEVPGPEVGSPRVGAVPFVDDFPVSEAVAPKRSRRKVSLSFSAGGAFGSSSGSNLVAQGGGPRTRAGEVVDITEVIQHSTPVNARMELCIPLSSRLGIGTGLDLASHKSSIGDGLQTMKWVGVPLELDCAVWNQGPCSVSVGAGVRGEKCLSASLLGMDYNESFQWAANVGADCRVSLFGPVSLLVSPELDYYLTDTVLPTYRTGKPLSFGISAGLSFNL